MVQSLCTKQVVVCQSVHGSLIFKVSMLGQTLTEQLKQPPGLTDTVDSRVEQ